AWRSRAEGLALHVIVLILQLFVGISVIVAAQATPATPAADTILINGHVITVDSRFSIAEAIAIRDGRFVAVGTTADIRKLSGAATQTIDLHGETVTPGLADDHLHDAGGGPGVDLSRARRIADVLAAIAARVKTSRPGEVIVTNSDWHEAQLEEHRLPYRRDLDTVSPDNPVVVVRGGHEYILNSAALAKRQVTTATPHPPLGPRPPAAVSRQHHPRFAGGIERRTDRSREVARAASADGAVDHRGARHAAPEAERRRPDEHPLPGRVGRTVSTAAADGPARPADDP